MEGNAVHANGWAGPFSSAGIYGTGSNNVVRDNHLVGNANAGIMLEAAPNSVYRNTARDNGTNNYATAPGNDVGPIGSAAASTSPWANIQF